MLLVIGFYKKNLKLFIELKVFICYINVITWNFLVFYFQNNILKIKKSVVNNISINKKKISLV